MSETKQTTGSKYFKYVIFTIAGEEYGFDILAVNAIEKQMSVVSVPNAPSFIRGIINLRGEVIPVYSLRKKFSLPENRVDEFAKLIVVKINEKPIAFEVDEVKGIIEISSDSVGITPEIVRSPETAYIECVANVQGRMILLMNFDGIFTAYESKQIDTFMESQ